MAVDLIRQEQDLPAGAGGGREPRRREMNPALRGPGWDLLRALASLKLTIALFAMAMFMVFVGTLAQVDKDISEVIDTYFRLDRSSVAGAIASSVVWVDLKLFFPPSFFPHGPELPSGFPYGFPFPNLWLIGIVLGVNLLAAHAVRFTIQAQGARLTIGMGMIVVGLVVTLLVILSGSSVQGMQGKPLFSSAVLWWMLLGCLAALAAAAAAGAVVRYRSAAGRPAAEVWLLIGIAVLLGGTFLVLALLGERARLNDSNMRILWQLMKATFAAGVLLAGCLLLFRRRAGIVLIHGGVAMMMVGELLVGVFAVENFMRLREGETKNYLESFGAIELAVVDASDPKEDRVLAIDQALLVPGETIRDKRLPFDVRVVELMRNSELRAAGPGERNPATAGLGLRFVAEPARPVSGTDASRRSNMPSAYVELIDKASGEPIGTHLVSLYQSIQEMTEKVTVGGTTYDVALRYRREYQPYSMYLEDVRRENYIGTDTPRFYGSTLRLVDPSRGEDRLVKIKMNEPLRYAGATFYQSGYWQDPQTGVEYSTLQVVTNMGWMIPYVGCMIVAVGMLYHFWLTLLRFLGRGTGAPQAPRAKSDLAAAAAADDVPAADAPAAAAVGPAARLVRQGWDVPGIALTLLLVLSAAAWFASTLRPPRLAEGEPDLAQFARLPIVYQGRVQPIDSFARNSLRILSNRETFVEMEWNESGEVVGQRRQPAVKWLLDLIARPDLGFRHRVFAVKDPELRDALELPKRKGGLYSIEELRDKLPELRRQAALARQRGDAREMTAFQKRVLDLDRKLGLVDLILESFRQTNLAEAHDRNTIMAEVQRLQALGQRQPPLIVPPVEERDEWRAYTIAWTRDFIEAGLEGRDRNPATRAVTMLLYHYGENQPQRFNQELQQYQSLLAAHEPADLNKRRVAFEAFYNRAAPLTSTMVVYAAAFLLALAAWLFCWPALNRAVFWMLLLALAVHTLALVGRIYISGRPPVTNLYSSAVFIGWGCVLGGLVVERVFRLGVGNVVAAVTGMASLVIAYMLAADGDTFRVLQAVLDTNFWLATHVVTIALGYVAVFVAGFLGISYLLAGAATPLLSPWVSRQFARMIYGVLCFAIFFSFIGTVLGGLWADDSWGRFWGWDPKENGALLIVLWVALVLHARWDKLIGDRGLAVLAIGGNIITAWSWFGVNELGVGLHSYGFTEGVLLALGLFVLSQLAFIGLGLLPRQCYWSYWAHRPAGG